MMSRLRDHAQAVALAKPGVAMPTIGHGDLRMGVEDLFASRGKNFLRRD